MTHISIQSKVAYYGNYFTKYKKMRIKQGLTQGDLSKKRILNILPIQRLKVISLLNQAFRQFKKLLIH